MCFVKLSNRNFMELLADDVLLVAAGATSFVFQPDARLFSEPGAEIERRLGHGGLSESARRKKNHDSSLSIERPVTLESSLSRSALGFDLPLIHSQTVGCFTPTRVASSFCVISGFSTRY